MSELLQIVCKNVTLTLVHFLVLLCDLSRNIALGCSNDSFDLLHMNINYCHTEECSTVFRILLLGSALRWHPETRYPLTEVGVFVNTLRSWVGCGFAACVSCVVTYLMRLFRNPLCWSHIMVTV
jgi:hypothetical protein